MRSKKYCRKLEPKFTSKRPQTTRSNKDNSQVKVQMGEPIQPDWVQDPEGPHAEPEGSGEENVVDSEDYKVK